MIFVLLFVNNFKIKTVCFQFSVIANFSPASSVATARIPGKAGWPCCHVIETQNLNEIIIVIGLARFAGLACSM